MPKSTTIQQVLRELAALEDPKLREANESRGDDHGVNLTHLRALAKELGAQPELALQLWATGNTAARLLATLVCKPKTLSATELDTMIRDIRAPKLLDWFIVNVVKPGKHSEELRLRWRNGNALVGRAGWSLTTERVVKKPDGLDLDALLSQIEKELKKAPEPKQWAMNHCLAEIGIHHPEHRARAIEIGERLEVLIDYPASPGCTPPYAPMWIAEMVRRNEGAQAPRRAPGKKATAEKAPTNQVVAVAKKVAFAAVKKRPTAPAAKKRATAPAAKKRATALAAKKKAAARR